MPRLIGLDVGGVIINAIGNDGTDTTFRGDNFMATTAVEGVHEAVREMIDRLGASSIFILSKCGEVTEAKTRKWFSGNGFYSKTGFDPANLYFCRTRAAKAPIAKELGLTDFVDDRVEVLKYMENIVARRYLFGPQSDQAQNTTGLVVVQTWNQALAKIMQDVA